MADLTQNDWTKKLESDNNSVILDVRTDEELEQGMIPGAKHIDIYKGQDFIDEILKLDKSKNYFVYCKSGGRSAQTCAIMSQLGFENTFNLVGGFTAWQGEVTYSKS